MTLSIPFFNALRSLFFSRARQEAATPTAAKPVSLDGTVKLTRMIVIVAQRAGNSKALRWMATEVGNSKIVFKSSLRVREGELVNIEMLLQGYGTFKAMAKVEWVLSSNNSYTGELTLWSPRPDQRQALQEFSERQRRGSR